MFDLARTTHIPSVDDPAPNRVLITGLTGFFDDTHVVSNLGWRAVQHVQPGDHVLTFDHAMQVVTDVRREVIWRDMPHLSAGQCPVVIPEGAFNNRRDLWLMPDQGLLVESDLALDAQGDPFAVVPARALDGFRQIQSITPQAPMQITTLIFEQDEAIYVEGGMIAHCPRRRGLLDQAWAPGDGMYEVLTGDEAREVLAHLPDANCRAAFLHDPDCMVVSG